MVLYGRLINADMGKGAKNLNWLSGQPVGGSGGNKFYSVPKMATMLFSSQWNSMSHVGNILISVISGFIFNRT